MKLSFWIIVVGVLLLTVVFAAWMAMNRYPENIS